MPCAAAMGLWLFSDTVPHKLSYGKPVPAAGGCGEGDLEIGMDWSRADSTAHVYVHQLPLRASRFRSSGAAEVDTVGPHHGEVRFNMHCGKLRKHCLLPVVVLAVDSTVGGLLRTRRIAATDLKLGFTLDANS
ncbi:hypothetical protein EDD15DRAFT_2190471 [Pisolithus albus]|nr:hypothetical protein EDD15DRAFT_2190471 [Pisolithus albus]